MLFLIPVPSFLIWIGVVLSAIAVCFGLLLLFGAIGAALAGVAMIFSRISFGLFVAFMLSQNNALLGMTGWNNFLAWAAIVLVITFVLCKFPRISQAIQFMATFLVCYLVIAICVCIVMSLVTALFGGNFDFSAAYSLTVLVISLLFAAFATLQELANADSADNIQLKNPIWLNVERIVAAAIYGLVLTLITTICLQDVAIIPVFVQWIMVAGFGVTAYFVDIILPRTPIMDKLKKVSFAVGKTPVSKEEQRSNMIDRLK